MAQDGLPLPLEASLSVLEEPGLLLGLEIAPITAARDALARFDEGVIRASGDDRSRAPLIAAIKATPFLERQA